VTRKGAGLALAAFAATVVATQPAASQSAPESRLGGVTVEQVARHAILAPQIVDYEGTKVMHILRGQLMETVTVSEAHKRPNRTRLEFLSPEGLAGRLVIDDGNQTWQYEPRLNIVIQGPSLAPPLDGSAEQVIAHYHITLLGVEEVIGRQTAVLSLTPRVGRGSRRLWIDRLTGVALRTEEIDPDDGVVARTAFTRISYGLNFPAAMFRPRIPAGAKVFSPTESAGPLMALPALERMVGFKVGVPATLPDAFKLIGGEPVHGGPVAAAHVRYTDGARFLSLFVAPARQLGPPGRGEPVSSLGPQARTIAWGATRLLQWEANGMRLTLVGMLPLKDLLQIAAAVKP
jgi:outer membrane lipoprotein-sorting protein